jgi:transcriptional regulator with XRE-family HTH domain
MRDSAFGPVAIPPDFWVRPDVSYALERRDIGEVFRLLKQRAGLSQNRIGVATGLAQGRVSEIANGKYQVQTIKSLSRIADGLGMLGTARAALGLAPGSADQATAPPPPTSKAPRRPLAAPKYPATADQAVTAATDLWHADAARRRSFSQRRWTSPHGTPPHSPGWSASPTTPCLPPAPAGPLAVPTSRGSAHPRRCSPN